MFIYFKAAIIVLFYVRLIVTDTVSVPVMCCTLQYYYVSKLLGCIFVMIINQCGCFQLHG